MPGWAEASRPLQLQLGVPEGFVLTIQPQAGGEVVACPPRCNLIVHPGKYKLDAQTTPGSPWRRVVRTVEIADDSRLQVVPGNRSDHDWGVGLTISGSIVFGLGLLFFTGTHMSGSNPSTGSEIATYGMMGVGAPMLGAGIYMLVQARNRVVIEHPVERQMIPVLAPPAARVEVGWRF